MSKKLGHLLAAAAAILGSPTSHNLCDLLRQSKLVEANKAGQCVWKIKVPSRQGPAELSTLIFATEAIVPRRTIPTLPAFSFELKTEEPNHANISAATHALTLKAMGDPVG